MSKIILPIHPKEGYFGQSTYKPNSSYGPRQQRGIQIFHMIAGNVTISVNAEKRTLKAGDSILLLPGRYEFFQFDMDQSCTHDWCQLDFDYIPDGFNEYFVNIPSKLNSDYRLDHLINVGLNMQTATLNCNQALLKLAEATLHYYIESTLSTDKQEDRSNKRVILAKQFIENNYHLQITLKDISENIYYSIPHLIHLFKVHLSTTPANYLRHIRIKHAKRLLKETDETIALIAERCGFASQFHFSRIFKEEVGVSPKYFRLNQLQNEK